LASFHLDGVVNSADLALMGSTGPVDWYHGDLNYDGVVNADDWSLFLFGDAFQTGAYPRDNDEGDDTAAGEAILAQAEAEFSGETNDEIRSQVESQMDSAVMIAPAPEPMAISFIALLPTLANRRRRRA
jgi:hypothetical protein